MAQYRKLFKTSQYITLIIEHIRKASRFARSWIWIWINISVFGFCIFFCSVPILLHAVSIWTICLCSIWIWKWSEWKIYYLNTCPVHHLKLFYIGCFNLSIGPAFLIFPIRLNNTQKYCGYNLSIYWNL